MYTGVFIAPYRAYVKEVTPYPAHTEGPLLPEPS
jgi:hypothetical protein